MSSSQDSPTQSVPAPWIQFSTSASPVFTYSPLVKLQHSRRSSSWLNSCTFTKLNSCWNSFFTCIAHPHRHRTCSPLEGCESHMKRCETGMVRDAHCHRRAHLEEKPGGYLRCALCAEKHSRLGSGGARCNRRNGPGGRTRKAGTLLRFSVSSSWSNTRRILPQCGLSCMLSAPARHSSCSSGTESR